MFVTPSFLDLQAPDPTKNIILPNMKCLLFYIFSLNYFFKSLKLRLYIVTLFANTVNRYTGMANFIFIYPKKNYVTEVNTAEFIAKYIHLF